jgi:hypothetical protein
VISGKGDADAVGMQVPAPLGPLNSPTSIMTAASDRKGELFSAGSPPDMVRLARV